MNIIVFGSNGFIGKSIVEILIKKNHQVICFDLQKKSLSNHVDEYYQCDLKNITKYKKIIKNADIFLNLVGYLGVKETQENPLKVLEINLSHQLGWLNTVKKWNIKRLVFISSSEVYGDINLKAVSETSPVSPKSDYGVAKLAVENLLRAYSKAYKFEYNIIRYFNIYGPNQRDVFVIPKFINRAINNETIHITGDGSQVRTFCYIDDAVDATIKVILSKKCKNHDFNIGNSKEPISIKNLSLKVKKIFNSKINIKKRPFSKADRPKNIEVFYRRPDTKKLKNYINYAPKTSLNQGMKKIYKIIKINANKNR